VTSAAGSDETGIVVAGIKKGRNGADSHYYVLEDATMKGTPSEWAKAVTDAYWYYNADRVVAEVNNGGDLVEQNIRSADRQVSFKAVRATRGKVLRAEPIAALYERGLVHHVGEFPLLEDQMCNYTGEPDEKSPDRMDALVWALTMLSTSGSGSLSGSNMAFTY
jgi:phage terminase large subunit-like protein